VDEVAEVETVSEVLEVGSVTDVGGVLEADAEELVVDIVLVDIAPVFIVVTVPVFDDAGTEDVVVFRHEQADDRRLLR
jgi:hypothetical protein